MLYIALFLIMLYFIYKFFSRKPSIFSRVINFFQQSTTKYFSPLDLAALSRVKNTQQFVHFLEALQGNPLYTTLSIGQLLKEIWRDRNLDALYDLIYSLQRSSLEYKQWRSSLIDHEQLYIQDFGQWEVATELIASA
jgi:hypothetical protein